MSSTALATGQYVVLYYQHPGQPSVPAGVIVTGTDPRQTPGVRLRRDWLHVADEDQYEILSLLQDDLRAKGQELGGEGLLRFLEEHLSNTLTIGGRQAAGLAGSPQETAEWLYRREVPVKVLPFETHLPKYSLRAAAGKFGPEAFADEEPEEWVEVDEELRLTESEFAVQVVGDSMNRRIPDGSLCVFDTNTAGSRQGQILLVELQDGTGVVSYTVKRYRSEKAVTEDGYQHTRILLEPMSTNPVHKPIVVTEDHHLAVIARFVRVL